jgi:hypothetical protein
VCISPCSVTIYSLDQKDNREIAAAEYRAHLKQLLSFELVSIFRERGVYSLADKIWWVYRRVTNPLDTDTADTPNNDHRLTEMDLFL